MNREEILSMEAGEELDSLMATDIMEEPMPESTPENALDFQLAGNPIESPKRNWVCLCSYDEGDIPTWRPLPYSTDIWAAWQVWRKVTAGDPFGWAIYSGEEDKVSVEHYPEEYMGGLEEGCGDFKVSGLFPEAMSKAALIAKLTR